jgi:hypothetical protein
VHPFLVRRNQVLLHLLDLRRDSAPILNTLSLVFFHLGFCNRQLLALILNMNLADNPQGMKTLDIRFILSQMGETIMSEKKNEERALDDT